MRATLPLLALLSLAVAQAPAPVVDVGNAQYQGTVNAKNNISTYFGIRYAAAPVGDLRFRAPQSPPALAGVQQATTKPPLCLQASSGRSPTNPNPKSSLSARAVQAHEDCLFLNVHFPGSTIPTCRLPVIVWIHGDGYVAGSASSFNGGDLIIRAKNSVVVVVIQYRLGIFGFLAGSKVKANGALNAGLLDQEFALKWVQQHISKFGGDPDRVTIWGESAGAGSVLQHVVARNGSTNPPLFRAAISSSSFLPSQHPFDGAVPERIFSQVVSQAGCGGAPDALSCLRTANVSKLQAANTQVNRAGFFGTFVTVPVVDGDFITQRPTVALRQRRVNGEALLAMTNTHEGNAFVNPSTAATVKAANYALRLFPDLGTANAAAAARLYAPFGSPINQVNAIMGESIFVCPSYFMLDAFPAASFKGEFAVPNGSHAEDIAFYFPSGRTPAFKNLPFVISFAGAFVDFATSLDPNEKIDNGNITPLWSKYLVEHSEMLFNRTANGRPGIRAITTSAALLQRCAFWESVGHLTAQ
ncbi:hypothetical protein PC9H_010090 [Pleurotus ostreatus]|uniref:Carboxylic ester hydrolase n=1 Tax=Pleurotus ostreatus TaxID=5322 RepID=A0A8H7DNK2_PLEOS|nr:uncharacterized protein PC9H_010090 [Pleurotus ostreatus]KAF7424779.1 hypothetical protein PC9H_010090 [Pleurotus ostreatus]KAJ8692215.1 hypothetical protein PTI98_009549 [Pleurotus ostreatus]